MPIESVAAYINNTFTFILFILVCTLLFFVILGISTILRKRILKRNTGLSYKKTDGTAGGKSFTSIDPFKNKNTVVLGMTFILVFLSVILILASFYFSLNMAMGSTVYIISFTILSMITVLVYMFKAGGIK
jgi:hypothetical protein